MQPLSANQITRIAELIATKTPSEIAQELGVPRSTIYRRLAKTSTKRLVEIIQDDYTTSNLPVAAELMGDLIQEGKEINGQGRYKACERLLEGAGVLPSATPSIYIQQIFQNNQITLNPVLKGVLDGHLKEMDEIVDVEAESCKVGSKDVQLSETNVLDEKLSENNVQLSHTNDCTVYDPPVQNTTHFAIRDKVVRDKRDRDEK